jgi:hypothetical protein
MDPDLLKPGPRPPAFVGVWIRIPDPGADPDLSFHDQIIKKQTVVSVFFDQKC